MGTREYGSLVPDDAGEFRSMLTECASEDRAAPRFRYRVLHRDGHWVWLEAV